ncbi:hypothetical protein [Streptomyces sp. NPDC127190]|uniref:hypothetical protein n=1 Tax=unclassified Streptomyces TaxID=2593676 RepID=UPI003631D879
MEPRNAGALVPKEVLANITARHPRTAELLSTVKFMVQTLAAGELQRELAYGGPRAAEAKGSTGGHCPAVPADVVRTAYLVGHSVAALAHDHGVSRGAIRSRPTWSPPSG